ncbi:MAG: hypothetical protein M1829_002219 [Trizodia sp. TS-e1964]|nr:MAG: hypothetical protein M1829_002219 [Trizodia sp. TS-e1964]
MTYKLHLLALGSLLLGQALAGWPGQRASNPESEVFVADNREFNTVTAQDGTCIALQHHVGEGRSYPVCGGSTKIPPGEKTFLLYSGFDQHGGGPSCYAIVDVKGRKNGPPWKHFYVDGDGSVFGTPYNNAPWTPDHNPAHPSDLVSPCRPVKGRNIAGLSNPYCQVNGGCSSGSDVAQGGRPPKNGHTKKKPPGGNAGGRRVSWP